MVVRKFRTTTHHSTMAGKTQQSEVKSYNLDVIISVYLSSKKKLSGIKYTLQHFGNRHKRIKRPCSKVGVRLKVAPRISNNSTLTQFHNYTVQRFNSSFVCSMETVDCRLFPKYILAAGLSGRHRPYYPRSAIYRYGSICSAGFDNLSLCFGLFPLFCLCRCNASGCR